MCPTSLHETVSFVLRLEISILATAFSRLLLLW